MLFAELNCCQHFESALAVTAEVNKLEIGTLQLKPQGNNKSILGFRCRSGGEKLKKRLTLHFSISWYPPLEDNLKFMMFSRPICTNFCQHLTTRRAMNVNELSSISKTKVPIQGDTSAAVVAIAMIIILTFNHYYAWWPF